MDGLPAQISHAPEGPGPSGPHGGFSAKRIEQQRDGALPRTGSRPEQHPLCPSPPTAHRWTADAMAPMPIQGVRLRGPCSPDVPSQSLPRSYLGIHACPPPVPGRPARPPGLSSSPSAQLIARFCAFPSCANILSFDARRRLPSLLDNAVSLPSTLLSPLAPRPLASPFVLHPADSRLRLSLRPVSSIVRHDPDRASLVAPRRSAP